MATGRTCRDNNVCAELFERIELLILHKQLSQVYCLISSVNVSGLSEMVKQRLMKLWDKAHYEEELNKNNMKKLSNLPLVARFRVRKRFPPPPNLCPAGRTLSSLPRKSRYVLYQWLSANIKHPYANKLDAALLACTANLTLTQVYNWLANARKRGILVELRKGLKFMQNFQHEKDSETNTPAVTNTENETFHDPATALQNNLKVANAREVQRAKPAESELNRKVLHLNSSFVPIGPKPVDDLKHSPLASINKDHSYCRYGCVAAKPEKVEEEFYIDNHIQLSCMTSEPTEELIEHDEDQDSESRKGSCYLRMAQVSIESSYDKWAPASDLYLKDFKMFLSLIK